MAYSGMSSIGFFIWSWNSVEWLEECLRTYRATTGAYLYGLANDPTDGSDKVLKEYCDDFGHLKFHTSIASCVNIGYTYLYRAGFTYMGFIHPDQRFFQYDWVQVLRKTLDTYPQIGKISCSNTRQEDPIRNVIFPGSEAANLIHRRTWEEVGRWDSAYLGYGGYEDWDYQQKLIEKGLASAITPGALMWHQGMGTRTKRNKQEAYAGATYNGTIYNNKWNTWEPAYAPKSWQDLPVVR